MMPTPIVSVQGTHPHFLGTDTPIGVDEQGARWAISYKGRNAILVATFDGGAELEFKIPTNKVNKSGSVAAFTIPDFGDAQWVTHREHVKFEVRFPTPPKVAEVSLNIARQNCTIVPDGQGGLDVLSGDVKVGALPQPWLDYTPDGSDERARIWLDWVVAEPFMKLTMPTLTASEWATAVLDPTVITTSTASTATAYSNQRKIDRTSNGVLWAMYWDGTSNTADSMHFRYSTDDGTTWADGGGFGFAGTGTTYTPNGSLFIDVDDYAHLVYKDRADGYIYYRRGTPNAARTAWTWGTATTVYSNTPGDYPDIVAHREGTGWSAYAVWGYQSGTVSYAFGKRISIASGGALTLAPPNASGADVLGGDYASSNHTYPSIDFNHTGDGKTVAGGTPHLCVAWSAGATGAGKGIRFKKATYSGGSWSWGTEREIDSTSYASSGGISSVFDGTRCLIAYADSASTSSIKVRERDAADTTTTTRTPTSLSDGVVTGLSVSYDDNANLFLGAVGDTSDDVKSLKYDRAAGTWGTWETVAAAAAGADTLTLERGYSNNAVGVLYTDGTGSPYSVTYDSIILTVPPSEGTTSGSVTNTGSAAGKRTPEGSASGSTANTGSASGLASRSGVAQTGTTANTGSAAGVRRPVATASGAIANTGSAAGTNGQGGVVSGPLSNTGAATGYRLSKGSTSGSLSLSGAAFGDSGGPVTASGSVVNTGSAVGKGNYLMFTPPVRWVGNEYMGEKPYRFYRHQVSMSVIYRNGHYQEVRVVDDMGLTEGDTWFPGGRTHQVTEEQRLLLEADGFTVDII